MLWCAVWWRSDGPFDTTGVALDILKWKKVSASFFLLGSQIAGREAVLQRMVREGHNLGGHSCTRSPHGALLAARSCRLTC